MAISIKDASIGTKIFVFFAVIFVSITVFIIVSTILVSLLFGPNINMSDYSNQEVIQALKLTQLITSIGLFIIPSIIFAKIASDDPTKYLGLKTQTKTIFFLLIPLMMVCSGPLINFLSELNLKLKLPESLHYIEEWMKNSEESAEKITTAFLNVSSIEELLFNLLLIAMIPAIGEELLFRGVLQKLLIQGTGNIHAGIWITAILFSAMHMQFFGFLPRMMMGVLFGYLFVWTKSLWIPILAHFVNNGMAVVVSFLMYKGSITKETGNLGSSDEDFLFIIFGASTVCLLLYFFYVNRSGQNSDFELKTKKP